MRFTIPLPPRTKKNSQRICRNKKTGKPFIIPSEAYEQYVKDAGWFLIHIVSEPIDYPINVKAIYFMPTKGEVDLTNLHECLHDVMIAYGIVKDDNSRIIVSTDGSRVDYDKDNPRTVVEISEVSPC